MIGLLLKIRSWFGNKMYVLKTQTINIEDPFSDDDKIIDFGGGGEGVIGVLRGKQVTAIDLRQDELDEAPDGPIKVVADARNLPFEENSFSASTAFYFFMYLDKSDIEKVIKEAFRVTKPGGKFYIWDVIIPKEKKKLKKLFVIPLKIILRKKVIRTAYGTIWKDKDLNSKYIVSLASNTGFRVVNNVSADNTFYIELHKGDI